LAKRRRQDVEYGSGEDERDDHVKLDGTISNVFAGGQFEVKTDAGATVRAQLCGRMRKYRVQVALSPYDLTHGMIVYRAK
jgi:translation initiation factor IF-1